MHSRVGLTAAICLSLFLLCGASSPEVCTPPPRRGPSAADIVATGVAVTAGVVIGAVVLVEVRNSHHAIKGCVTKGPEGLQVRNDHDGKLYTLVGVTAKTRIGDRVKLHGSKSEQGEPAEGDSTFVVEKVTRDYGPCSLDAASRAESGQTQ